VKRTNGWQGDFVSMFVIWNNLLYQRRRHTFPSILGHLNTTDGMPNLQDAESSQR